MWRIGRGIKPLVAALAIALISLISPHGLCQAAECGIVYYTVTKTYTKVQTVVSVDEVVVNYTLTTTTTRTQVVTQVAAEPGGILANFTCTWRPPQTLTPPPVAAPAFARGSDFTFMLLAAVAFGAFAAALVYEITRVVIFMFTSTAAIWLLAAAYPALAGLAAGLTALTVAFAIAAAFFKR
jgi:hypothetical protein